MKGQCQKCHQSVCYDVHDKVVRDTKQVKCQRCKSMVRVVIDPSPSVDQSVSQSVDQSVDPIADVRSYLPQCLGTRSGACASCEFSDECLTAFNRAKKKLIDANRSKIRVIKRWEGEDHLLSAEFDSSVRVIEKKLKSLSRSELEAVMLALASVRPSVQPQFDRSPTAVQPREKK